MKTATSASELLDRHGYALAAWLLVVLLLGERLRLLARFAWRYTDKDQVLMWTAARELLHGRLHEPRFYGQAYNSMLEGWLAAPLVGIGLPCPLAVPVVTSALAVVPFLVLAWGAWRHGLRASALGVLALPLLLPIEYGLITSMPRGFVAGIALAAVAACLTLGPGAESGRRLFAIAFLIVLSISLNPNAGIVAIPLALYLLLAHTRRRNLYLWGGAGALAAAALHALSVGFYRAHAANVVYGPYLPSALDFEPDLFRQGLVHADRFLGLVTPASGGPLLLAALVAVLIGALEYRGAQAAAIALGGGAALTVLALGLERVQIGSASVYWSWSRSYLAVPVLLGLGLIWLERATAGAGRPTRPFPRLVAAACVALVALVAWRATRLGEVVEHNLGVENEGGMVAWPVETVRDRCRSLADAAERNGAKLVVFQTIDETLAYGCEPLLDGRIRTLLARSYVAERRTWRIEDELHRGARTAILYYVSEAQAERARSLGVEVGPVLDIDGVRSHAIELPAGLSAFNVLAAMGLDGAVDLAERARTLAQGG